MKKEIYFCDRCGAQLDERNQITIIRGRINGEIIETNYDFCMTCEYGVMEELKQVMQTIDGKAKAKVDASPKMAPVKRGGRPAKAKEEPETKETKKEFKPPKRLDKEQIKSLMDAGWKDNAIAEAMHVTVGTISAIRKGMK